MLSHDVSGTSLDNTVLETLSDLKLYFKKMSSKGYDSTSMMRGQFRRVETSIKELLAVLHISVATVENHF